MQYAGESSGTGPDRYLASRPRDQRELDRVNSAGMWKSAAAMTDASPNAARTAKSDPSPLFGGSGSAQLPANATANASQVRPIRSRQKLDTATPASTSQTAAASAPPNVDDQVAPRRAQNTAAAVAASPQRSRRP